jgi:hypothetical protein
VDCVTALWLVQRELVAPSVKFVAAILQPVWPWDQHLTPARGAHLVGSVSVDKLPAAGGVGAKSSTNLDDHCLLITGRDRDLLTRWCDHCCLPRVRVAKLTPNLWRRQRRLAFPKRQRPQIDAARNKKIEAHMGRPAAREQQLVEQRVRSSLAKCRHRSEPLPVA